MLWLPISHVSSHRPNRRHRTNPTPPDKFSFKSGCIRPHRTIPTESLHLIIPREWVRSPPALLDDDLVSPSPRPWSPLQVSCASVLNSVTNLPGHIFHEFTVRLSSECVVDRREGESSSHIDSEREDLRVAEPNALELSNVALSCSVDRKSVVKRK